MQLQFATVDVFTADQFSGNPLAVVLNAQDLTNAQMQAIAAEFNLAETTFVLPPRDSATHRRSTDLHPAPRNAVCRPPEYRHRFRAGPLRLELRPKHHRRPRDLRGKGRSGPNHPAQGRRHDCGSAAGLAATAGGGYGNPCRADRIGLLAGDRRHRNRQPPALHRLLRRGLHPGRTEISRRACRGAAPAPTCSIRKSQNYPATSILLYTQIDEGSIDIRARMFAPHHGIPEDPATGSANVALIGLLARLRPESDLHTCRNHRTGRRDGTPKSAGSRRPKSAAAWSPRPSSAAVACR